MHFSYGPVRLLDRPCGLASVIGRSVKSGVSGIFRARNLSVITDNRTNGTENSRASNGDHWLTYSIGGLPPNLSSSCIRVGRARERGAYVSEPRSPLKSHLELQKINFSECHVGDRMELGSSCHSGTASRARLLYKDRLTLGRHSTSEPSYVFPSAPEYRTAGNHAP